MKLQKFFSILILTCTLASTLLVSGCKKEGCTNEFADNYNADADEDDGSCILSKEKFIAQYSVTETCPSGNYNFTINVVSSATADDAIIINDFGDLFTVNAKVSGSALTIPSQNVTYQGVSVSIDGSGSIADNMMTINYNYSFDGGGENCTMTCTKQ